MHQEHCVTGHKDRAKCDPGLKKSDLTNRVSFVELLYHRVEGWDRNLENHLQNAP